MKIRNKNGDPYIFASGLGVIITLFMVFGIVGIILVKGLGFFWPSDLTAIEMKDGHKYLAEVVDEQNAFLTDENGNGYHDLQMQLKIGNRDVYGRDFAWISQKDITETSIPKEAIAFERTEYGNFYGYLAGLQIAGKSVPIENVSFEQLQEYLEQAHQVHDDLTDEKEEMTDISHALNLVYRDIALLENIRDRNAELDEQLAQLNTKADQMESELAPQLEKLNNQISELSDLHDNTFATIKTAEGTEQPILLAEVVRMYQPNTMNAFEKSWHYVGKLWEFIAGEPRESNTEGGVFPAIYGTVLMVILMSIAVVPLGVIAAVYLNEYAKQGVIIRLIRLSVNNLAGVPSIVFGIFGLGFFIYMIGGSLDQILFSSKLPEPTFGTGGILWASLTLALLTIPVVIVATEEGILAVPQANRQGALALGATRWQMIKDIVLPNAMPGILTGLILAISRGAGEVAPLMITGVVKLAPSLPLNTTFPYLHLDQKFMHLGFHIYDVGFQSPNVEAAKPMVYMTALLLILIVIILNLLAIYLRNRMRKRFKLSAF